MYPSPKLNQTGVMVTEVMICNHSPFTHQPPTKVSLKVFKKKSSHLFFFLFTSLLILDNLIKELFVFEAGAFPLHEQQKSNQFL